VPRGFSFGTVNVHYGFTPSMRPNDESPVAELIVIFATVTSRRCR